MPKKRPAYREDRDHTLFLRRIKDFRISIDDFFCELEDVCSDRFAVFKCTPSDVAAEAEMSLEASAVSGSSPWAYRTDYETLL
jgi:hypothetical protein